MPERFPPSSGRSLGEKGPPCCIRAQPAACKSPVNVRPVSLRRTCSAGCRRGTQVTTCRDIWDMWPWARLSRWDLTPLFMESQPVPGTTLHVLDVSVLPALIRFVRWHCYYRENLDPALASDSISMSTQPCREMPTCPPLVGAAWDFCLQAGEKLCGQWHLTHARVTCSTQHGPGT